MVERNYLAKRAALDIYHACGVAVKKRLHCKATACFKCHGIFSSFLSRLDLADTPVYTASHDDSFTVGQRLDDQLIAAMPMLKTFPEVERQVSWSPTHSASTAD